MSTLAELDSIINISVRASQIPGMPPERLEEYRRVIEQAHAAWAMAARAFTREPQAGSTR